MAFGEELARHGERVTLAPQDETGLLDLDPVLDGSPTAPWSTAAAVRAAGAEVLYSCAEGTCGTCETDVLEGAPDHRDSVLAQEERAAGDTMMICVSRCRGARLVPDP